MLIHIANVTCKTSLKSQSISQIHLIYNFKGAQPDHMRVQSASCCFPRELVSFIRPRELERFNPWHMTRSPPIRKRIWVGRCDKNGSWIPSNTEQSLCKPLLFSPSATNRVSFALNAWRLVFVMIYHPSWISATHNMKSRLAIKFPTPNE